MHDYFIFIIIVSIKKMIPYIKRITKFLNTCKDQLKVFYFCDYCYLGKRNLYMILNYACIGIILVIYIYFICFFFSFLNNYYGDDDDDSSIQNNFHVMVNKIIDFKLGIKAK